MPKTAFKTILHHQRRLYTTAFDFKKNFPSPQVRGRDQEIGPDFSGP